MTRTASGGGRGGASVLAAMLLFVALLPATAATAQDATGAADTRSDGEDRSGRPSGDGGGTASEPDSVRLTVTGLTGVLGPGSVAAEPSDDPLDMEPSPDELEIRALVENDGDVPLDSLRLVVEIYPPARTRGLLRHALDGDVGAEQPLHVHDPAVDDGEALAPGEISGVAVSFERDEVSWTDNAAGGVHPVRIAVQRGTDVLDELMTAVVWLNGIPEDPLLTTMTWPIDGPPWRGGDGAYPRRAGRAFRPGGRLDVLLRTLEHAPAAPVVLAPSAHVLEDLADRSDGFVMLERQDDGSVERRQVAAADPLAQQANDSLTRIREIADQLNFEPVAGSYADADLPALAAGTPALRQLGAEAAAEGRRRTQRQLGREVDRSAFLVGGPLSPAAADLIPGDTLLLPYATTSGPTLGGDPPLGESVRPLNTPSGRILTALVADPYLEDALEAMGEAGPVISAHRVVAESAMAYLVAPNRAGRTALLLPPTTWSPSPRGARLLLEELESASWLKLTTPSDLTSNGRRGDSPVELSPPTTGPFDAQFADEYTAAAVGLAAVTGALPDGTTQVAGRPASELRDTLLRAGSRWYRGPLAGEAGVLVREVQGAVDATFGDVTIGGESVTLTSDSGTIPITLQRTSGGPITVAVEVESQGRLLWPDGRRSEPLVLTRESSQTVSFATRALSTGTFPVTVRVVDPDGTRVLARTGISVRSNAVSQPALAAIGIVVVVLLGLAAIRRRGRRPKHLEAVD